MVWEIPVGDAPLLQANIQSVCDVTGFGAPRGDVMCRCGPTPVLDPGRQLPAVAAARLEVLKSNRRTHMPIIAWLLGVPISVIILLMLFGVF
jgi:hypothetical protein